MGKRSKCSVFRRCNRSIQFTRFSAQKGGGGRPYFFPLQKGLILFLPSSDREFPRKCLNNIPERLWRREEEEEEEEEKEQRLRHKEGGGMKRKGAKSPHSKISHILLFMPASVCRRPLMPPSRTTAHEKRKGGGFPFLFPIMFPFGRRRMSLPVQKGKYSFFSHFLLRCGRTTLSQRKRRARAIHRKKAIRAPQIFPPPPHSTYLKKLHTQPLPPIPAPKRGGGASSDGGAARIYIPPPSLPWRNLLDRKKCLSSTVVGLSPCLISFFLSFFGEMGVSGGALMWMSLPSPDGNGRGRREKCCFPSLFAEDRRERRRKKKSPPTEELSLSPFLCETAQHATQKRILLKTFPKNVHIVLPLFQTFFFAPL